jgi:xylan 1,4-beta-xylosidase
MRYLYILCVWSALIVGIWGSQRLWAADDSPAADSATAPLTVNIHVDAAQTKGAWKPIWRFFGADEPNYATMKDGEKLLGELGQLLPDHVYFRTHNLLCTGDGTAAFKWGSTGVYREDAQGNPIYDWKILDHIFDTYLQHGIHPYVEIGFMPEALSRNPEPYQHHWKPEDKYATIFTGWSFPPKDFGKWGELVFQWASHCKEKYGKDEVLRWYWEVWNEANIGYWNGSPQQFLELHDRAVDAVRRAVPGAKVGGPDSAGGGNRFFRDFLEHCLHGTNYATGATGTPLDFVSFHAKGSPKFVDGHVRMGIANQLQNIDSAFKIIASFPELKDKPIVIGESDPDGCAACKGKQLGYRNGTMYSSYTAACFARDIELADKHGVNLEGALTWAFEFEDQPLFAGFRQLASGGIDLPVLNVFRMFSKMGGQRLAVESDKAIALDDIVKHGVRNEPDIAAQASLDGNTLCVMVWYYHDDDLPGPDADIHLTCSKLPVSAGDLQLKHYRIDAEHSNAFTVWQKMGSPEKPTSDQYAALEKAGQLTELNAPSSVHVADSQMTIDFSLPRQAVSLLVFTRPAAK